MPTESHWGQRLPDAWGLLCQDVYRSVARILNDEHEARDVCQEAVLRSREALARGVDNPAAYLHTAAVRLALDGRRRRKREALVTRDLARASARGNPSSPLALLAGTERTQRVWQAVQALPAEERAVLLLREIEGLRYAQIAERAEIPAGTVMSRLHRARERLRTLLATEADHA